MKNPFENTDPTVIKVYSDTCFPCKALSPIIIKMEREFEHVKFVNLNGPENHDLIKPLGITKVPTLVFVRGGEIKHTISGMTSEGTIRKAIAEYL